MFILGTICCRAGSKGVPGKNIKLLDHKPLLLYTIETALKCSLLNDIIVSTDSEIIAAMAKEEGIKVPFLRPAELSSDTASKWPVFIHAVEEYEKQTGENVNYIVDMDVTVPLKSKEDIEGAIQMAFDDVVGTDVVITGYEPERNPYFNMMEIEENGYAKIVKQRDMPIVRRQDAPKVYNLTPAAYVIKKEALYQYEHWSKARCKIYPIPKQRATDIDTELDFKFVEFLIRQK